MPQSAGEAKELDWQMGFRSRQGKEVEGTTSDCGCGCGKHPQPREGESGHAPPFLAPKRITNPLRDGMPSGEERTHVYINFPTEGTRSYTIMSCNKPETHNTMMTATTGFPTKIFHHSFHM